MIGDVVISGAEGDELAAAKAAVTLPRNFHATETDMIAARDSVASTGLFSAIEMGVYRDRTGDGHVLQEPKERPRPPIDIVCFIPQEMPVYETILQPIPLADGVSFEV